MGEGEAGDVVTGAVSEVLDKRVLLTDEEFGEEQEQRGYYADHL